VLVGVIVISGAAVLEIVDELDVGAEFELVDETLEDEIRVEEETPDPERVLVDNVVETGEELRVRLLIEPLEPLEELLG
jgi:hypothetical protein